MNITIPSREDRQAFAKHMAEVSLAWGDGRDILARFVGRGGWVVVINETHCFSWETYDYAIAPEPPKKKLVPWAPGPDLLGKTIKRKNDPVWRVINGIDDDSLPIGAGANWYTPQDLLAEWVEILPDGTEAPCGTEVEE